MTTHLGQNALFEKCNAPDILITNAGGPPFRDFRELERDAMLNGVTWNMITPIELIQRYIDGMSERGFGRILNITSVSVNMPVSGLDLSSGARAGLTAFCAGVCRSVAHTGVTINHLQPGFFDTDRYRAGIDAMAGQLKNYSRRSSRTTYPRGTSQKGRYSRRVWRGRSFLVQSTSRIYYGAKLVIGWGAI